MGLRCSCGMLTTPVTTGSITLSFLSDSTTRSGQISFTVNACADRLEFSTFSATFVDQSGMTPNRSFVFTSTNITVSCETIDGECIIIINGMGLVAGETTPRGFSISFIKENDSPPFVGNFAIFGFTLFVEGGDLQPEPTFFGC